MRIVRFEKKRLGLVAALGLAALLAAASLTPAPPDMGAVMTADTGILSGRTVILDPGHGGIDSGASGNGQVEKEITLALSQDVRDALEAVGAKVVMTRTGDEDFYTRGKGGKRNDLLKRVAMIDQSGAVLFLSIHTNSIRGSEWTGAEVYFNPKLEENRWLALVLQTVLAGFPAGNKRQVKEDSGILVLKDTTTPGVLIEAGFISNPREAALLADPNYRGRMAAAIVKALAYYLSHPVER